MKSNKQRKVEIKTKRRKRAQRLKSDALKQNHSFVYNTVKANKSQLTHNSYFAALPSFYTDKPFECRDCGKHEVWTAERQKWWYEIAKGLIESTAIYCRACRIKKREHKKQLKMLMSATGEKYQHPNDAFFRKRY